MSSAGITFSGLGSGLDTQGIITALLAVERRPITALEAKKTSYKTQKNLFGDLEELLDKLRDKADDLRKTTDFLDFAVSSRSLRLCPSKYSCTMKWMSPSVPMS